jgi:hypothetical protein
VYDRLYVAISVVAVYKHWEIACRHDVANTGSYFAESHQPDIGNAIAGTNERESSDKVRFEAGPLDQPGTNCIVCARKNEGLFAGHKLSKRVHGVDSCSFTIGKSELQEEKKCSRPPIALIRLRGFCRGTRQNRFVQTPQSAECARAR